MPAVRLIVWPVQCNRWDIDLHGLRFVATITINSRSSWCVSSWFRAHSPHDLWTGDAVKRISESETDACGLIANLSTAGLAEDCKPSFSVPFGGCVGAREFDGVDLSECVVTDSEAFLSPAGCGGTGVVGRGDGAVAFYRDLLSAYPSQYSTSSYLGNRACRGP